eukprot:sb/3472926/
MKITVVCLLVLVCSAQAARPKRQVFPFPNGKAPTIASGVNRVVNAVKRSMVRKSGGSTRSKRSLVGNMANNMLLKQAIPSTKDRNIVKALQKSGFIPKPALNNIKDLKRQVAMVKRVKKEVGLTVETAKKVGEVIVRRGTKGANLMSAQLDIISEKARK